MELILKKLFPDNIKTTNQDMQGDRKMIYQRLIVFDKTSTFFDNSFSKQRKGHIFMSSLEELLVKLDFRRVNMVVRRRHWKRRNMHAYTTLESFVKFVIGTDLIQYFTEDFSTESRKVAIK